MFQHSREEKTAKSDDCQFMQFTGLLDKNGKEIYEGDIMGEYQILGDFAGNYEVYGKIYFDTDLFSFCVERSNGGWEYLHEFYQNRLTKFSEVIGNIYENPQLLTSK